MLALSRKLAPRDANAQEHFSAPSRPLRSTILYPVPWQTAQFGSAIDHSITSSTSPAATVASAFVLTDNTRPDLGDFISFCIVIATTTTRPAPSSTSSPSETSTRTTV